MSLAFGDTNSTRLGRIFAQEIADNAGKSGFYSLSGGRSAFAARMILADAAEKSLDIQYYIWRDDEAGNLLFDALYRAAERGVKVRLLLDDINTGGLDETLAALDAHPNFEVRLYNPLFHRRFRILNYVTDFKRINRRMHNKSFTVDNQVTIVGGRNVGNEYFDAGRGTWFIDLDSIAVGPIVTDVTESFEVFWHSAAAYPAGQVIAGNASPSIVTFAARVAAVRANPQSQRYLEALGDTPLVQEIRKGELPLEWATAHLLVDSPTKTLVDSPSQEPLLLADMLKTVGPPQNSFDLVSPYFVPGEEGSAVFAGLAQRGIKVRILTNSVKATDVRAVHAGYAKRRPALLAAGVQIFELIGIPGGAAEHAKAFGSGPGSSAASLHAKTFAVDGARIFVGSFNFDKRSAHLNTEMGFVIDSPVLAQRLVDVFRDDVPKIAYDVRLSRNGHDLEWREWGADGHSIHKDEPGTGYLSRAWIAFLSHLPIEWLL